MNLQVIVIEYWRRTLDGREYCSNRLFRSEVLAREMLRLSGYRKVDDDIYSKGDMKAVITVRTIE